jgi:hypothetical protein
LAATGWMATIGLSSTVRAGVDAAPTDGGT